MLRRMRLAHAIRATAPLGLLLSAIGGVLVVAAPASAGRPFIRGISENLFLSANDLVRDRWFGATKRSGATLAGIGVSWREVAPGPPPANPLDPADPAYRFDLLDASVRSAAAHGLAPVLVVHKAPDWAEATGRPGWAAEGTWKPKPAALAGFAEALGRRYSGQYADAEGLLPRVRHFEVWNEPNLNMFLTPQVQGGRPFSPVHYRKMLNAFAEGVGRSNPSANVLGPATAPVGGPSTGRGGRMRPLRFIRGLFCLRRDGKPKRGGCGAPARMDILSHHPISLQGGPGSTTRHPDNLTVTGMKRLTRTLRAAERARTVRPSGRRPVWATELWWLTGKGPGSVTPRQQARYLQLSAYLLWRQGVRAMTWFQIKDNPGFPSGLFSQGGSAKPSQIAFRFPFVTQRRSKRRVSAWGIPQVSGRVVIQRRRGGRWHSIRALHGTAGMPFQQKLRIRGSARLRARVDGRTSLTWKQS